jgi:hypothetical protein
VCHPDQQRSPENDSSKPNGQRRKDVDTTIFKNQIKDFKFKTLTQGIKEIYAHYE